MTQLQQPSPATAPRDLQQLMRLGRFNLRKLAEEIGILNAQEDPVSLDTRQTFMGMNTEEQARTVLQYLQNMDANGGSAPAPQAAPTPAPAAPAPAPTTAPAATNGTSHGLNGGGLSSGGLSGGLKRTPVTKDNTPPATAATQPTTQPAAPVAAQVDLTPVLTAVAAIAEGQKALTAAIKDLATQVLISNSALLLIGEEMVKKDGLTRQDILDQAVTDSSIVADLIAEATKVGKGKKK